jgi:hypothetical protein
MSLVGYSYLAAAAQICRVSNFIQTSHNIMTQADWNSPSHARGLVHGAVYQSAKYRALSKVTRQIHRRGTTPDDFQVVVVKNKKNSELAQTKQLLGESTSEEVTKCGLMSICGSQR